MITEKDLKELKEAAEKLQSPLLRKAAQFIENHEQLTANLIASDESYKAGVVAALREVWKTTDHTRVGHPEEETVHIMACDIGYIGSQLGANKSEIWRGFE